MKPTPDFQLPQDLPPETAMALFDLLSGLIDALWQHYEIELVELIIKDLNQYPASQRAFDFDDNLPF
jgi:hypothetical protein